MTYAGGRRILDADAHIMEPPGWLESFATEPVRALLPPMDLGDPDFAALIRRGDEQRDRRATDPDEAAAAAVELMAMPRKGWGALGDGTGDERSRALDLLGFEAQLVFPTASFPQVLATPADAFPGAVEAMNRGLAAFCADDPRLLSTAYVPMQHGPEVALDLLRLALAEGADTVMVDMVPPRNGTSHTHPDLDPVWAAIVDADRAVMVHVGLVNGWSPVRPSFFRNGRTLEHFRSDAPGDALSFLTIGYPAELFIGSLIYDGVLDRHPGLRFGVVELGASWVPSFLRSVDVAANAFRRLQDLSHLQAPPSEYVRRHFCFSPFAGEDVGFLLESGGPELFMFSSDYPHHEGSDDPIRRFERTMPGATEADREAFYSGNFARLVGARLPVPT